MNALDLLYIPVALVTAPAWAVKKRRGWGGRFGKTAPLPPLREGAIGRVLLHAVSVGEVNALRNLVPLLAKEAEVVVSTTTDTGLARAKELFSETCHVVRYPLDFSWAVRRFLNAVRPDAAALVELEVWPNFVRACKSREIPICIINGRLSERSAKGYRKIKGFFGRLLNNFEFAAVQDQAYAARFEALGLPPNKCFITGSMKWDSVQVSSEGSGLIEGAVKLADEMNIDRARPLIVAGSTGPGEEELLHEACPREAQLLCAPRKPERFDEAAAALPGCVRRTEARYTRTPSTARVAALALAGKLPKAPNRFLLDTIGELRKAYSLADIVVVGRSFGDLYGSDPIEPIGLGKATVMGPAASDFAAVVQVFEEAGGIVRTTRENLGKTLRDLLTNPSRRRELGELGRGAIRAHQGASQRHAELLLGLLERRPKPVSGLGISSGATEGIGHTSTDGIRAGTEA
jgi:3-deoxy-D-manno-octulosonic-acid transferase